MAEVELKPCPFCGSKTLSRVKFTLAKSLAKGGMSGVKIAEHLAVAVTLRRNLLMRGTGGRNNEQKSICFCTRNRG